MPIRYDDIVSGDIVKFESRRYRTGNRHRQIQKQPISYRLSISYRQYRYIGNIVNSPSHQDRGVKIPGAELSFLETGMAPGAKEEFPGNKQFLELLLTFPGLMY